ncbi:MAG: glycosyltransferase family 39 protein [Armatimonadetes bacterium]|nr:glycosyltransferase family 39 protein [Armatimonadota bacterium]
MAGAVTAGRVLRLPRLPAAVLLAAGALALFTIALGQGSLWDQDEPRYTDIARQITERGDPITLYHNGEPWFVHPPLYMWLVAATGALFGFSEFTARIWTSLFGAAGVLVTFLLGRRLYDGRTGLLAGLILMTTLAYFVLSRLAIFDVVLVAFMLSALYMVLVAEDAVVSDARRRGYRWAFVWAGLATLTKGPIGLLLPAMVVGAWWLMRGVLLRRLRALPWEGFVLYALIGLSWYGVEAVRHGRPFLERIVGYYMVTRFVGVVENQPGPWYYYLPVLALGGFPWSAFLPSMVVYHARRLRQDGRSLLLLLWIGVTLLFYSVARTKLPNYILPIFPVAAVGVARLWARTLDDQDPEAAGLLRWGAGVLLVAGTLLGVALALFGRTKYPAEFATLLPHVRLVGLLLAAGVVLAAWLLAARSHLRGFVTLTGIMAATLILLVTSTVPQLERVRATRPMAEALGAQVRPQDRVVGVGLSDRASLIYYSRHPIIWAMGEYYTRRSLCGPGGAFLIITRGEYDRWARAAFSGELTVLSEMGDMVLLKPPAPLPCPAGPPP